MARFTQFFLQFGLGFEPKENWDQDEEHFELTGERVIQRYVTHTFVFRKGRFDRVEVHE